MTEFLLALAAFLVAHLAPALPGVRARLVALAGRGAYLAGYSILSLGLLAWVIAAARRAEDVTLWEPAAWQWLVPVLIMPFALFLIIAGLAQPNPLSISFRREGPPGPVVAITRHPVLWGFLLWALAHLPANGRVVPIVLFGVMALFSLLGFVLLDRKARRRLGEARWRELAGGTSIVPGLALLQGRARVSGSGSLAVAALAALALDGWFLFQGHGMLIGPEPWAGLMTFY